MHVPKTSILHNLWQDTDSHVLWVETSDNEVYSTNAKVTLAIPTTYQSGWLIHWYKILDQDATGNNKSNAGCFDLEVFVNCKLYAKTSRFKHPAFDSLILWYLWRYQYKSPTLNDQAIQALHWTTTTQPKQVQQQQLTTQTIHNQYKISRLKRD